MAILPTGGPDHSYVLAALQSLSRSKLGGVRDEIVRPIDRERDTERTLRRAAEDTHDVVIISAEGMRMLRALQASEAAQGF